MSNPTTKPYITVGAGRLTACVYKTGDQLTGFDYRFNITRLSHRMGRVNQWLTADDVSSLVKLAQVLAAELASDGCTTKELRHLLIALSAALDDAISEISHGTKI